MTLGQIKALFPGATFEVVGAAWVTENDAFFRMTGTGLPGRTYLAFHDPRPENRRYSEEAAARVSELEKHPGPASDSESLSTERLIRDSFGKWASEPDEEALTISWIRWGPDEPIPLARYVSHYGAPEKSGFAEDDMRPYRAWPKRGVKVNLTDDEKNVASVEFEFTNSEMYTHCMEKVRTKADTSARAQLEVGCKARYPTAVAGAPVVPNTKRNLAGFAQRTSQPVRNLTITHSHLILIVGAMLRGMAFCCMQSS